MQICNSILQFEVEKNQSASWVKILVFVLVLTNGCKYQ